MMLDTYVVGRLDIWARWRLKYDDNGNGYPRKCSFVIEPSGGFWSPEMCSGAWDVERCVMALIPERQAVIRQAYVVTSTCEQKAKACGCAVQTYYNRLHAAHNDILGYLNDIAAGIALPVIHTNIWARNKKIFAQIA